MIHRFAWVSEGPTGITCTGRPSTRAELKLGAPEHVEHEASDMEKLRVQPQRSASYMNAIIMCPTDGCHRILGW